MTTLSWPSSGGTAGANPSVALINQPIPGEATLVGGENPSGNLTPLMTDANGYLYVSLSGTGVEPIPVSQSGVWNITNITGTVSLPTGASTSALQTTGNTTLTAIQANQTNGTQVVSVSNFPATQPISGTVTANQGTANATPWNENIAQYGGVATSLGQKVAASSVPTVLASDQITLLATAANQTNGTQLTGLVAGSAIVGKVGIDQTTPGTTNGVQVNAALPAGTNNIGKVTSLAGTPTALTVTNAAITVGTSAVRLTVSGSAPAFTRVVLVATPDSGTASTVTFYIGTSTVTNSGATRGVEIQVGQSFIANNDAGDYWIVASVAAQTVTVMEQA